jgi:hypothetical protein
MAEPEQLGGMHSELTNESGPIVRNDHVRQAEGTEHVLHKYPPGRGSLDIRYREEHGEASQSTDYYQNVNVFSHTRQRPLVVDVDM